MITDRIKRLAEISAKRGKQSKPSHFDADYHTAALTRFSELPHWEKLARSMAYAIENQDIWCYDGDSIGGRIYYSEAPVAQRCDELDCDTEARVTFEQTFPDGAQLKSNQLIGGSSKGHITWFFDRILSLGTEGMLRRLREALATARDAEAEQFYRGAIIMMDALQSFNDRHVEEYRRLGNYELADRMERVPRHPCESFRDAVQAFFMQHIVVMRENPHGGNGPGRLDYYLWPYLERDLKKGIITLEEAKELIDELFLRINERIYSRDGWVEAIVVGGSYPNGASAVNPLTYIMIDSVIDLDITHPSVYVRIPADPSAELIAACARYMVSGCNRAQILNDPSVIGAMVNNGIPYRDAVEYGCGGCMEVSPQGMTSDLLYIGWQNTPKMLELMVSGGVCLRTGRRISAFKADKGLASYSDFDSFYADFIAEANRITEIFLKEQDIYSEVAERNRPCYLLSSMLDDCIARGRNMHGGGVRYHDYGGTHLGLPNVADGLYAIRRAVFEDKLCTAEELVDAMSKNYQGYEKLRAYLRSIPKYGMDDDGADAMAARVMRDFAQMYNGFRTRHGGRGKPVVLTFIYSPQAARTLGATPDGRLAGEGVAQGLTPQACGMKDGITAAVTSLGKMPFECFSGGASSMWDFDSSWANEEIVAAVLKTFIQKGGQIFQGNTTSVEDLLKAKENPEGYEHLIVRVGGYSARFVNLALELQQDVINRIRHKG